MVCDAANFYGRHFVSAGNAAEIRPETFLKVWRDVAATFFGAPRAMQMAGNESMHVFCRPYGTCLVCGLVNPPLKRWAIVCRAKGAFGFLISSEFISKMDI